MKILKTNRKGKLVSRLMGKNLRSGITLIELTIVLLVLGILIAVLYSTVNLGITDTAKKLAIQQNAAAVPVNLERYEFENPQLLEGDSLKKLAENNPDNPSWRPLKEDAVKDPWKNFYFICSDEIGKRQICSYGADGQPGGEGKNADFYLTDSSSWPDWLKGGKAQE